MEYTVAFAAPADKIYADFISREYWQALMQRYGQVTPHSEVTSFASTSDGTDIVFTHLVPRSHLPPVARNLVPVDLVITRSQHFDPFEHRHNRATGEFRATVTAGPGHFSGRYLLSETDDGSQLRLSSVCKVRVPLIGGKLEALILDGMADLFTAEEEFAADWIAEHH